MYFKIISKIVLLSLLLIIFSSCKQNNQKTETAKEIVQQEVKQEVKKEVKKVNSKKYLASIEIDRSKTPYAGVWEPSDDDSGFLLLFPDGKLELYGKYDKNCKRAPKKQGTYKVVGERNLEITIDGKVEVKKIEVLSSFFKIDGLGVFFPPRGVKLKEENKEYTDPKDILKFCREVNTSSISKIYPYLTEKSKFQLMKIGILDKNSLAGHDKFTTSIAEFLSKYKKIISIESTKKEGNSEMFKLMLKDMEGNTFAENIPVKNENGKLRCGFFDNFKLVSSRKDTKEISFWFKEFSNSDKTHVFKSKNINNQKSETINVKFENGVVDFQLFKSQDNIDVKLDGKFKIIANTPNVVAILILTNSAKKDEGDDLANTLVFKYDSKESILLIFNDKTYTMVKK
jgi:hypothetical protein